MPYLYARLDPDKEAALSVAAEENFMALADNTLVSITYLFYCI
jgi:hypothetical protein